MKLVMNADDFGLSEAVNLGILKSFRNGIVRSTTLMTNMPGLNHAVHIAKKTPGLGVGIHLVLTAGDALTSQNKSITDENGRFLKQTELFERIKTSDINFDEVEREFTAQIEKAVSLGLSPTHLDSHHHVHLTDGIFQIALKLAEQYKIGIRVQNRNDIPAEYKAVKSPDRLDVNFYGEDVGVQSLIQILDQYKDSDEAVEVMCHPAYLDDAIMGLSSYLVPRTKELATITDSMVLDYIHKNGIMLCGYRDL